jgi:hypothetical protein
MVFGPNDEAGRAPTEVGFSSAGRSKTQEIASLFELLAGRLGDNNVDECL